MSERRDISFISLCHFRRVQPIAVRQLTSIPIFKILAGAGEPGIEEVGGLRSEFTDMEGGRYSLATIRQGRIYLRILGMPCCLPVHSIHRISRKSKCSGIPCFSMMRAIPSVLIRIGQRSGDSDGEISFLSAAQLPRL